MLKACLSEREQTIFGRAKITFCVIRTRNGIYQMKIMLRSMFLLDVEQAIVSDHIVQSVFVRIIVAMINPDSRASIKAISSGEKKGNAKARDLTGWFPPWTTRKTRRGAVD